MRYQCELYGKKTGVFLNSRSRTVFSMEASRPLSVLKQPATCYRIL